MESQHLQDTTGKGTEAESTTPSEQPEEVKEDPPEPTEKEKAQVVEVEKEEKLADIIIICGYRPSNHLTSSMRTYSEGFGDQIPEEARYIIFGAIGSPRLRRRELDWDVDSADPGSYSDGWSLASEDPASLEVVGGHNVRQTSAPEPRKDG